MKRKYVGIYVEKTGVSKTGVKKKRFLRLLTNCAQPDDHQANYPHQTNHTSLRNLSFTFALELK